MEVRVVREVMRRTNEYCVRHCKGNVLPFLINFSPKKKKRIPVEITESSKIKLKPYQKKKKRKKDFLSEAWLRNILCIILLDAETNKRQVGLPQVKFRSDVVGFWMFPGRDRHRLSYPVPAGAGSSASCSLKENRKAAAACCPRMSPLLLLLCCLSLTLKDALFKYSIILITKKQHHILPMKSNGKNQR